MKVGGSVKTTWKSPTMTDTLKQYLLSGCPMSVNIDDLGIREEILVFVFRAEGAAANRITSTRNDLIGQYIVKIKDEIGHQREYDTELTDEHRKVLLDIINSFIL